MLQSLPTFLTESSHYFRNWAIILLFQHFQTKREQEWRRMISISRRISTAETHEWAWTSVAHRKFWKSWDGNGSSMCYVSFCCNLKHSHLILCSFDQARLIRQNRVLARNGIDPSGSFIGPCLIWLNLTALIYHRNAIRLYSNYTLIEFRECSVSSQCILLLFILFGSKPELLPPYGHIFLLYRYLYLLPSYLTL